MNRDHGVAIITGGASGIGLAIAKAAVGEGWKVLLADLTQPALDAAKAQVDAIKPSVTRTVVMDVASYQQREDALAMLKLVTQSEQQIRRGQTLSHRDAVTRATRSLAR